MLKRKELYTKYIGFLHNNTMSFDELALDLFRFQSRFNPVYNSFLNYLNTDIENVTTLEEIPFLPVSLYKNHAVKSGDWISNIVFESSTTTGSIPSKHHIYDLELYISNAKYLFEESYGKLNKYYFLALLPSYMEKEGSSLIYMVNDFISNSSGKFFNYDYNQVLKDIREYKGGKQIVLIGVTYALLEMAELVRKPINEVIIMETGGMKGRRKELPRQQVHEILKKAFSVNEIHSEYGMTELLSQSYSKGNGVFSASKTMKFLFADIYDPFSYVDVGRQGRINIVDLANIDSCSFLSTDDLGRELGNGRFEVLGRTDESDIRGCNLLFVP